MPQNNTATTPTHKNTHTHTNFYFFPWHEHVTSSDYEITSELFSLNETRTDLLDWQLQQRGMWRRTSSRRATFPAVGTLSGAYIWSAVKHVVKELCNFAKFQLIFIDTNIHQQLCCSQRKFSQRYEGSNAAHSCTHCKRTKEHHEEIGKC